MSRPVTPRAPMRPARRLRHLALLAVAAATLFAFAAPTATSAADPTTDGIDISHWQNEIDWTRVAGAGKRFAFMKASEDHDYVDPTYGLNRARAKAAGLRVGAYHFAQPSKTAGDALAEADHFLDTAVIDAGDLPPVLDLEQYNGLSVSQMQTWVRTWLDRVHDRTGVHPAIYVSPNFWENRMGNTDEFATSGYRTLWIAHWTTAAAPRVPAGDWAGFGWTFWQVTSDGAVPGISGRVDLNVFDGTLTDLATVLVEPSGERTARVSDTPFTDISSSKFARDIAWLYVEGITSGCSATKFCPTGKVSRGQMAAFLSRALDLPKTTKDYFRDDERSVHETYINRLAKAGLTSGCGSGRYCPNDLVTRGQLASFLSRVLDLSPTSKDYFRDDERSTHESNINRIARAGLTSGCSETRYCPNDALTRGQMAAFLHRTFDD
jgi:GH25 family lysozyme M1 (1,4-beta-N-acetylmuramidase)